MVQIGLIVIGSLCLFFLVMDTPFTLVRFLLLGATMGGLVFGGFTAGRF